MTSNADELTLLASAPSIVDADRKHESVFAGEGLGVFKTSVNRVLLQD